MEILLNGKETAAAVRAEMREQIDALRAAGKTVPGLAVILVGDDPASAVYVRNKKRACEEVGMHSEVYTYPADTSEAELLSRLDELNGRADIHGILVQLPLPTHISEERVVRHIDPCKDVDAFHPYNVGKIMLGEDGFLPCTPAGVMELLRRYDISVDGKECVIVGRSNIVGKPQAMLLLRENGTVTVCHSHTRDLAEVTRRADILIVAIGRAGFITGDMVKPGAVVVDVGINRMPDGKLCGDVDFASVAPRAYAITPVPGGVGPMTITMLLRNTLRAALCENGK